MRRTSMTVVTAALMLTVLSGCTSGTSDDQSAPAGRIGAGGGEARTATGGTVNEPAAAPSEEAPATEESPGTNPVTSGSETSGQVPLQAGDAPAARAPKPLPAPEAGGLPYQANPAQNTGAWVVYVATSADPGDASLGAAADSLSELGYAAMVGAVSCDTGAAEALGVPGETYRVGIYFGSQGDGNAFTKSYGGSTLGPVQVTATCQN